MTTPDLESVADPSVIEKGSLSPILMSPPRTRILRFFSMFPSIVPVAEIITFNDLRWCLSYACPITSVVGMEVWLDCRVFVSFVSVVRVKVELMSSEGVLPVGLLKTVRFRPIEAESKMHTTKIAISTAIDRFLKKIA